MTIGEPAIRYFRFSRRGIADTNEESMPAGLIKLADCRLYAAKEAGRNRFIYEGCRYTDSSPEPAAP